MCPPPPSGSLDKDSFHKAILTYRNIPCPFTRASPAMLLFGRPVRDMIPTPLGTFSLHQSWQELLHHRERAMKERLCCGKESWSEHICHLPPLNVGDACSVQNQVGNHPRCYDKTGRVVEVLQNDQYRVKMDGSGRISLRNRKFEPLLRSSTLPSQIAAPLETPCSPIHPFSPTSALGSSHLSLSPLPQTPVPTPVTPPGPGPSSAPHCLQTPTLNSLSHSSNLGGDGPFHGFSDVPV